MKKICWVLAIGCVLAADAQERVPPVAVKCDWARFVLPEMGTGLKILVHSGFVLLYLFLAFIIFVIHKKRVAV